MPGTSLVLVPKSFSPEDSIKRTCHLADSEAELLVLMLDICQVFIIVKSS